MRLFEVELLREVEERLYELRELPLVTGVRLTEEELEPVLRRSISSLPVRLLPDERTTCVEDDDAPVRLVTTRTEELRSVPLYVRRVAAPLSPVRDEDDAFEACLSASSPCRRVEAFAEVR